MFEFSAIEAGYIISQEYLESLVGYGQRDNPAHFDRFLADVYGVFQRELDRQLPHLRIYPAVDFKGFVILDPQRMTPEEITLYQGQRDRLLRIQAQQDIKRSELGP